MSNTEADSDENKQRAKDLRTEQTLEDVLSDKQR